MEAIIRVSGVLYVCRESEVPTGAEILVVGNFKEVNVPSFSKQDGVLETTKSSGVLYDSYIIKHTSFPKKNLEYTLEKIRNSMGLGKLVNVKHVSAPDHEQLRFEVAKASMDAKAKAPSNCSLPIVVGVKNDGENLEYDLARAPHMLVSGTTGSGKSFAVKGWVRKILRNQDTKVAIIDPKRVDFQEFAGDSNLFGKGIFTETRESVELLEQLCIMMDNRYKILEENGCQDINELNRKGHKMFRIVLVIDELADLMLSSKNTASNFIERLCQKSRACGIHLILCTQRPSVKVVTGIIKANVPVRISFRVNSRVDSMVILDRIGAENLEGVGRGMNENGIEFQSVS